MVASSGTIARHVENATREYKIKSEIRTPHTPGPMGRTLDQWGDDKLLGLLGRTLGEPWTIGAMIKLNQNSSHP